MKKIAFWLTTALLALSMLFAVGAADYDLEVNVTPSQTVVSEGETFTVAVTVDNISLPDGIVGGDFTVHFDADVLELKTVTPDPIDHWNMEDNSHDKENGNVRLLPADSDGISDSTVKVTESGKIKYTLTFTVKKGSGKNKATIEVTKAQGNKPDLNGTTNIKCGSAEIKIKQPLATPDGLAWEGMKAKWGAVDNAASYQLKVFLDGSSKSPYLTKDGITATEYDFTSELTEGGTYRFSVVAIPDSPEYAASAESAYSLPQKVIGKLLPPSITLKADDTNPNGGLLFTITDGKNAADLVASYTIEIFEGNGETPVLSRTVESGTLSGAIALGSGIVAGKQYTATVSAGSTDTGVNENSERSARCAAVAPADKIVSLVIKTMPKLSYVEKEVLDLSGMVVTVTYETAGAKDVTFAEFETYHLKTDVKNGKSLAMSDSGKTVVVSFGNAFSVATSPLTVKSSACEHPTTHTEHEDPTCGAAGYDRQICDVCGVTVSQTDIPATGEHQFSEWEIVLNPTATMNGLRERRCSVCGKEETEEIPATGTVTQPAETGNAGSSTSPSTTTAPETVAPSETVAPGNSGGSTGGMSDLSRIFLIIVIVVFSLILLFILGGVWYENRKNKTRKAGSRPSGRSGGSGSRSGGSRPGSGAPRR